MSDEVLDEQKYGKVLEKTDAENPAKEVANRFPEDRLLRKFGFQIWERKENAEAVWRRKGTLMKHSDALKLAKAEKRLQKDS